MQQLTFTNTDTDADGNNLIDKGIWLTGSNTGINIYTIEELEHLQKIFYTLQGREKRTIEQYENKMEKFARLYHHVLLRAGQLGLKLKCEFTPMQKVNDFKSLEGYAQFFKERVCENK